MLKLKINNTKRVTEDIQLFFKKLPEGDFLFRLNAIFLIAQGMDCSTVSKLYKKSVRTIHSWVNSVNKHGINALKTSHRPGRPSSLSELDKEQLKKDLAMSPKVYGYNQVAWDGILLSQYLYDKFNITLKPRRCQYLFHELGFSLKRPRKIPDKASPEAQEEFKKNSTKE